MRRTAAILALVAAVFLFSAPEVRGGGGLVSPPKTIGPAVSFSVVTVIASLDPRTTQGQTALRVQKSGTFDGALFFSSYVSAFIDTSCIKKGFTLQSSTEDRFKGYMDAWVPLDVRSQLFSKLGNPANAAITDINDISCDNVGGIRSLSFTGTIQFATTSP